MESLISVFSGNNIKQFFSNEIGAHRFQRVPPTESKGRVHTSTVSVAILNEKQDINIELDLSEIDVFYTRGTGKGGQHKNVTNSCVVVRHNPSGIEVRIDGRNQHKNKKDALAELKKRIKNKEKKKNSSNYSSIRNKQIKNNKNRRTYNLKSGIVKDHITGNKTSFKNIMKGKIELLH